ncbi:MAG TPA: helix-turn-helix domain-containing protein [Pyrinomonadaceae bacterium]|jgi:excisionase family DNA binding protein
MDEIRLPDPLPKFLEVREVAILLRISKRTVYDWVSQGRIPYRKAGDRTIFLLDEIIEWTRPDEESR